MTEPALGRRDWLPAVLWAAAIGLLPFGRLAELPMALAALAGLLALARGELRRDESAFRLAGVLFAGYWLPQLLSAVDAADPSRAWKEVALDLRYLPMLLYFSQRLDGARARQGAVWVLGGWIGLWCLDGLLQAATGLSLGGPLSNDRLSGIFGADDLKLGAMVAVLSPFLLLPAWQRGGWAFAVAVAISAALVLLAGTRAAWIMYALVLAALLWQRLGARRGSLALGAGLLAMLVGGVIGYFSYPPFAQRIERSAAALSGDRAGIDHALAFRLPIWETAGRVIAAHPLNGTGTRGFRAVYVDYAEPGDRWIGFSGEGQGAAHPHQLLLEILTDTGVLGLLCWLLALGYAWRSAATRGPPDALRQACALALLAMLFPLNTHYAVYSSAWGGLLLVLLAGWAASTAAERPLAQ